MRSRKLTFGDRVHCPFLRPFFLSAADEARMRRAAETHCRRWASGSCARRSQSAGALRSARDQRAESTAGPHRSGICHGEHGLPAGCVPAARLAPLRRIQRRISRRTGLHAAAVRAVRRRCRSWPDFARGATCGSTVTIEALLEALLASYRGMGRTRGAARDRHRRLAQRADLDGVRDPAGRVHRCRGADGRVRPSRARRSTARPSRCRVAARQDRSRLSPRAHQRHRRASRRVCGAGRCVRGAAPCAWPTRFAASSRTRRRSLPC